MEKIKKILAYILMATLCLLQLGGNGGVPCVGKAEGKNMNSEEFQNHIQIYTKNDLDQIREKEALRPQNVATTYVLMKNIYFSKQDFEKSGTFYNGGAGWDPIYLKKGATFDGNGKSISGLYMNAQRVGNDIGLFNLNEGTIKNLSLQNCSMQINNTYGYHLGGIVGYNKGVISNCKFKGKITSMNAGYAIGGIVGYNEKTGTIEDCQSEGEITPEGGMVGGIVANNGGASMYGYGGLVKNCSSTMDIILGTKQDNSEYEIGGIAGTSVGNVVECHYDGTIKGKTDESFCEIGGIVGYNGYSIENCYNTGCLKLELTGVNHFLRMGGICGCNNTGCSISISCCYNKGTVYTSSEKTCEVGGICGYNKSTIENCYNIGKIIGQSESTEYSGFAGGIVGNTYKGYADIKNCYNIGYVDGDKIKKGVVAGISASSAFSDCYYSELSVKDGKESGKCTIDEMRNKDTYVGFDFDRVWTMPKYGVYKYPVLQKNLDRASDMDKFINTADVDSVLFNYQKNVPDNELAKRCALYSLFAYRDTRVEENGKIYKSTNKVGKCALGNQLATDQFKDIVTYNCDSKGEKMGLSVKSGRYCTYQISKQYSHGEDSISYYIAHRKVIVFGKEMQQIIIVFRGTFGEEWYGNFDVAGERYLGGVEEHDSFRKAKEGVRKSLENYIEEMKNNNKINSSEEITYLITGHSRGAAVANLLAHDLSQQTSSVYAYTFATPNVATNEIIKKDTKDDNIFNYCFNDDFVPNLPLAAWDWGKYGKTFWTYADKLSKKTSDLNNEVGVYLGTFPFYNRIYTNGIKREALKLAGDLREYYNYNHVWYIKMEKLKDKEKMQSTPIYSTLHQYMKRGIGGVMQKGNKAASDDGMDVLTSGLISMMEFSNLTGYFYVGGKLRPALDNAHQPISYYEAISYAFNEFKESSNTKVLTSSKQAANQSQAQTPTYNQSELAQLKAFANTDTNLEKLGWDLENPSSWGGITWSEEGRVTKLELVGKDLSGVLDVSNFSKLEYLDVSFNTLTGLNTQSCDALTELYCSGNHLESLELYKAPKLTYVSCDYNYLDCTDASFLSKVKEIESSNDAIVSYEPQSVKPTGTFSENGLTRLKSIYNTGENKDLLEWNLQKPDTWNGVTWELKQGTYYLKEVDFSELGLTGKADFSGCSELSSLHIEQNRFTALDITGCTSMESLWCNENELNVPEVSGMVGSLSLDTSKCSYEQQYLRQDITTNKEEIDALKNLITEGGLDWDINQLTRNDAIGWEHQDNGEYVITSLDFSYSALKGNVDLSKFAHLKEVKAEGTDITSIKLPESMEEIADFAFINCTKLTNVSIPSSIERIGIGSFLGCDSLQNVSLDNDLLMIENYAFGYCYAEDGSVAINKAFTIHAADHSTGWLYAKENGLRMEGDPEQEDIKVEKITLSKSELTMKKGEKNTITAEIMPENATNKELQWSSSNESVATVSSDGVVEAKGIGSAKITCMAKDQGKAEATCAVTVTAKDLTQCKITLAAVSFVFDGKTKMPEVAIAGLTKDKDYTVSYSNNLNAGTAKAVITGCGEYAGNVTKTFTIQPKAIVSSAIKLASQTYTYDGKEKIAGVTVKNELGTLQKGKDYTLSYKNTKNAGTASVTITGMGNYTGKITKNYTINKKPISLCKYKGISNQAYTGKSLTPTIQIINGSRVLKNKTDYTIAYKNNKYPGKATITISGKGNYSGKKELTFIIVPKRATIYKVTAAKNKKLVVTWKKDKYANGYLMEYATKKNFKSGKKTINITDKNTTSKTIKSLSKGKRYYVHIRSYKTIDKKKQYGDWSKTYSCVCK